MGMKKALCIVMALAAALLMAFPYALAEEATKVEIEQCVITMPEIEVYLQPHSDGAEYVDDFESSSVTAALGSRTLRVESLARYDGATAYYFLVDVSKSLPAGVFKAFKSALLDFIGTLRADDTFTLITIGNEALTALNGTESREEAVEVVNSLERKDNRTMFYDAVILAAKLAKNSPNGSPAHKAAFIITDGQEDAGSLTGGTTASEMKQSLEKAGLPLFALGVGSNRNYLNALGEFARGTGGDYAAVKKENCAEVLNELTQRTRSCYLLKLRAENNIIGESKQQLILKFDYNGKTFSVSKDVEVSDWIPDNTPPEITDMHISGSNEITVAFSEPVVGADVLSNYSVAFSGAGRRKTLAVTAVSYDDTLCTAKLTMAESLRSGNYDIEISNVTDKSMESNALLNAAMNDYPLEGNASGTSDGNSSGGVTVDNAEKESFPVWAIVVCAVLAIAIIAFIVIAVTQKKDQPTADEENAAVLENELSKTEPYGADVEQRQRVHVPAANGVRCMITSIDAMGTQRTIEANIMGQYVVGRAVGACDLSVEDRQLSRRHFMVTCEDGYLYIEDLGSMNGTQINGIPLIGRRVITGFDVITAGNSKFSFSVM